MNYNNKHEEMKLEALEAIKETLESGYDSYVGDLHNEVFNTDYYIIGTYQAKEALKEYGVFEAISLVQNYEKDNFGEIYTNCSDPEKLINMVFYIIGEDVLYSLDTMNNTPNIADEDFRRKMIAEINDILAEE